MSTRYAPYAVSAPNGMRAKWHTHTHTHTLTPHPSIPTDASVQASSWLGSAWPPMHRIFTESICRAPHCGGTAACCVFCTFDSQPSLAAAQSPSLFAISFPLNLHHGRVLYVSHSLLTIDICLVRRYNCFATIVHLHASLRIASMRGATVSIVLSVRACMCVCVCATCGAAGRRDGSTGTRISGKTTRSNGPSTR